MIKIKSILLFTFLLVSFINFAQSKTKVIAVITKADWCPTCKANGERIVNEVLPLFKEPEVKILVNDLTDKTTKLNSQVSIKQEGIENATSKSNTTGEITLINATTKEIITKISVAKPTEKIKKAFTDALEKA